MLPCPLFSCPDGLQHPKETEDPGFKSECKEATLTGVSVYHGIHTVSGLHWGCQDYTGRTKTKVVLKENSHLHAQRHKHLVRFDFAFVYICRNKIYAWKPFAENESNFNNKFSLQGANVYHMGFSWTHWLLGSQGSFWWLWSLSRGVHLLQRQSLALVFILQKTKSHDQTLRAFAWVSVSVVVAVGVWRRCHNLRMQWVLQEVQMVTRDLCCPFLALHFLMNTFLHGLKQQSSLEFMFNQQFRVPLKNVQTSLDVYWWVILCNKSAEYFVNKRTFDKRCSTSVLIVLGEVIELLHNPLVEL